MESVVSKRIREVIEVRKMNVNSFSKKIGVTRSTINSMFEKGTEPGCQTIIAILSAFPTLSAEWLLRGDGSMFKNKDRSNFKCPISANFILKALKGCKTQEEEQVLTEELDKILENI